MPPLQTVWFSDPPPVRVLTLLLVGGRIAPPPPPASFSALYGKRLKTGTWNFLSFPTHFFSTPPPIIRWPGVRWPGVQHSLGMLHQIFKFLLCAEAPPEPLARGMFAKFRTIFSSNFRKLKIWLCVMNLFIEKLVLKFGRNRSRNNEVMTILNIWWKNGKFYFWSLNPKFSDFLDFRKWIL